jgi:hypothetical protein
MPYNRTPRLFLVAILPSLLGLPCAYGQTVTWPGARARHHLIHDPVSQRLLLLGGARDTLAWSWDGSTWRSLPATLPARANYAAAYDSDRDRLIVHGGSSLAARAELDDTWEMDRQQQWQLVSPAGPGMRAHHALVYDPVRKQSVLFGNSDNATANDTWGWDGRAWKLLANDGPPRRGVYGLTFDTRRRVTVLFGGYGSHNTFLNDTWEWDGRRWTQIKTPTAPSPRFDTQLAFDASRGRVLLFGGRTENGNTGDSWEYDGQTWVRLDIPGPPPRNGHAMVYDPRAKAIVLFGGRDEPTYFNDLWTFDGTWRQIQPR